MQFNSEPEAQLTVTRDAGWPALTPPGKEGVPPNVIPNGCRVIRTAPGDFLVTLDQAIGPNEVNSQVSLVDSPTGNLANNPCVIWCSLPQLTDVPVACTKMRVRVYGIEAGALADPPTGCGFSLTIWRSRVALPGQ